MSFGVLGVETPVYSAQDVLGSSGGGPSARKKQALWLGLGPGTTPQTDHNQEVIKGKKAKQVSLWLLPDATEPRGVSLADAHSMCGWHPGQPEALAAMPDVTPRSP